MCATQMQGYPGGAQPGYPQYPGQVQPGYQPAPQYPPAGYVAQPAVGFVAPGQPGVGGGAHAGQPAIQPSYAPGAQQQPCPPARPEDVNFQLPPNGIVTYISVLFY